MTRTSTQHSPHTPAPGSAPDGNTTGVVAPPVALAIPAGHDRALAAASRRAALAGGAAVLALVARTAVAGGAPSTAAIDSTVLTTTSTPTASDAGLVAWCAELDAMQRRIDALFPADWTGVADSTLEAADAAAHLIEEQRSLVLDRIGTLVPVSPAGCVALARSLALLRPDLLRAGADADPDVRLTAVLLRGLVGQGA